jgi:hypothetical protein
MKKEYCKEKIKGEIEFFIDETDKNYVSQSIPNTY